MINHAHLKHHPSDSQRVGVPGARIFTHLRVGDLRLHEEAFPDPEKDPPDKHGVHPKPDFPAI